MHAQVLRLIFEAWLFTFVSVAVTSCSVKLNKVLLKTFGFSDFHSGQKEASLAIMHKQDVLVHMATGSGKSLCVFLGPLAMSDLAVGVIISPLNGLMEQQICE